MIICNPQLCTGCGMCADICPKQCITMRYDANSDYSPCVDESQCIHCDKCKRACQVNIPAIHNHVINCYACWSELERETSASGGIAAEIAKYALSDGVAVGCIIADNAVKHVMVDNSEDLLLLKGSKYAQSKMQGIYQVIEDKLKAGKVTFFGTPCQVAGVKKYCEVNNLSQDGLLLVDLICHGTPSQEYIEDIIATQPDNTLLSFRNNNRFSLGFKNKPKALTRKMSRLYMLGFMNGLFYRDACYTCPYASSERVGDITLGDFWEISKVSEDDKRKGISLVLANTIKGMKVINSIKEIHLEERPLAEAIAGNGQLKAPSNKHENFEKFRQRYDKLGFYSSAKMSLKKALFIDNIKKLVYSNKMTTWVVRIIKHR